MAESTKLELALLEKARLATLQWPANVTSLIIARTAANLSLLSDSDRLSNNLSVDTYDFACVMSDMDEGQVLVSHKVYLHASLLFVMVGLIGNILSMLVFSSAGMRAVSSNVYLLTLALSDSMYLISVFMTKILTTLRCFYFPHLAVDVFNRYLFLCKALQYLLDLLSNYSTCLIMAFTMERFFAVHKPLVFKESFTVLRARITCLVLFMTLSIWIAPYHMMYIGMPYGVNVCTVLPDHEAVFSVLYIIEVLIFRIFPVFVITILNIFIINKLVHLTRAHRRRKAASYSIELTGVQGKSPRRGRTRSGMTNIMDKIRQTKGPKLENTPKSDDAALSTETRSGRDTNMDNTKRGRRLRGGTAAVLERPARPGSRQDKNMQMTVMLIVVSTTYIIDFMPVLVHFVLWRLQRSELISVSENSMVMTQNYTKTLYICGFAMNFFLYTISGRVFREQLINIFKDWRKTIGQNYFVCIMKKNTHIV